MSYKDYDNLEVEKAVEKLISKSMWDEEDVEFAKARKDYLTPAQYEAITGEEKPGDKSAKATADEAQADADKDSEVASSEDGLDAMKLDDLRAKAAEMDLDTSGKKADLIERIRAAKPADEAQAE